MKKGYVCNNCKRVFSNGTIQNNVWSNQEGQAIFVCNKCVEVLK